MKKIIFLAITVFIAIPVFGQSSPTVLIDRNGRVITSEFVRGRGRTITAAIFSSGEIGINLEHSDSEGRAFAVIVFTSDHFTDIDSVSFSITADRTFTRYSQSFDSIVISASKGDFQDRSKGTDSRFYFTREYKDGQYISKFEMVLPGVRFDVIKYAKEFTVDISIGGKRHLFSVDADGIRATQDAGLVMSLGGFR